MTLVQLDRPLPFFPDYRARNDCGPHAAAMAISFYYPGGVNPASVARDMAFFRVPVLGATLPWGIRHALGKHHLNATGASFRTLATLRESVAANQPAIVIVRPTDLPSCPWFTLHYRVLVGYLDDPLVAGGGELYFNCSAAPQRPSPSPAPGNVTVDYRTFLGKQWHTYLTRRWAVSVWPR
ncbi:MAG: C39 family peptidase [Chloroflexi bacterium]|nr:C39 family peptidase [Chloroflexota bacterium]